MAIDLLPFDEWQAGTLQNSVPANTNALRSEVLAASVISKTTTAQPGSPTDGDCYIIPSGATGTQWATFAQDSLAYYRGGNWYEFTAYEGLLKVVAGAVEVYNGSSWEAAGGGSSAVPVQDEGSTVVSAPTAINFVGAGVTATNSSGVATVTIPGGSSGIAFQDEGSAIVTSSTLNVVGAGATLTNSSGVATLTISGSGSAPEINAKNKAFISVLPGSSSINVVGFSSPSTTGTPTGVAVSGASIWQSQPRIGYNAASTTTAVAGVRDGIGGGPYLNSVGGYSLAFRMGPSTGATVASHRFFFGLRNTLAVPTDVEPSTLTNMIGLGYDSADTQVQIMHNDASGTATKVALGSSFPKPTTVDSAIYELVLKCTPGASTVTYSVKELIGGATASGTLSTNLPASTTLLSWSSQMSAGGTATAISLVFFGINLEFGL